MQVAGTSHGRRNVLSVLLGATLAIPWFATSASSQECVGDCNLDRMVAVNELIVGVNIALGSGQLTNCPGFDTNGDEMVSINELIVAVNNALTGCPPETPTPGGNTPTATDTAGPSPTETTQPSPTETSEPTATATPVACPLEPGVYTITQTAGGMLKVSTFDPFPFPTGGTITEDVGPGDANCVHQTVVPFPGGFSAPTFCIPALGYSVHIDQTGCGVGRIDSDGGSDFTVTELGDTSDSSATCNLPNGASPGPGAGTTCTAGTDASIRVDVTVGDGTPDVCTGSGTANALVVVPVFTTTWAAADGFCPDGDGTYDAGTDTLITQFPQILDFTTDTNTATFTDIDGDGCSIAGFGPTMLSASGECMDIAGATVTTGAAGTIGSPALPFDITFSTTLPNSVTGPEPSSGATCASPPAINFNGTATRCIQ